MGYIIISGSSGTTTISGSSTTISSSSGTTTISGSDTTVSSSYGTVTYGSTGSVGNDYVGFINASQNITLTTNDCGKTIALSLTGGCPGSSAFTCSLPTPTASIVGCTYRFVLTHDMNCAGIMLSASKDPLTSRGSATAGTGSFRGFFINGSDQNKIVGMGTDPYGCNLIKFAKIMDVGGNNVGAMAGDSCHMTCVQFDPSGSGEIDEGACYWLVSGVTHSSSSVSGTNNPADQPPWSF